MKITVKTLTCAIIFVLTLWVPNQLYGWGATGHRIVGEIADYYLSAKARAGVRSILGSESLAIASNWGDFIKSDTSYKYLDSWHYVNLPAGLDKAGVYNYLQTQKIPNIYNKTLDMISVLKNPQSTMTQKKMAMRLIIHFIGDMNQPMHTGRVEDLGGNRVQLTWFNEKTNLHRVWDEQLITFQQLSYTEFAKAINHPTPAEYLTIKNTPIRDAIFESYEAVNRIYAYSKPDDKLSYRYNYDFVATLNSQLLKGGIRLAKVFNDIYR